MLHAYTSSTQKLLNTVAQQPRSLRVTGRGGTSRDHELTTSEGGNTIMISRSRTRALSTLQPQTLKTGTHTSDETDMMTYQLNKEKAMKKKLKACSRQEPVILEQTNGGLRMHLQTGMYEAMRHAIIPYYGVDSSQITGMLPIWQYNFINGKTS